MVNPPLSGTGGIYLGNQILSPFDQPGPVTRSRSRSRNETLLTGTDDKTPHRLPFGSIDSNSSASSSSTTSSARSDTSGYNQGREGTPITPPSDYGENVKGLEAPSYAADSREVPTLLLPSRGLSWESSGDSNGSREVPRPSTPQPTEEDEDPWSTGSTNAVTQGLGFVKRHDESPTVRRVRTLNLKKLADAAKAAKAAEAAEEAGEVDEDGRTAGISEALGELGLDSENNDTESTQEPEGMDEAVQEPEETDEAVVSGASYGPQLEQQQQTSFVAADSSSSSGEDGVSSFPNSETAVLLREVNEQSDAAITPTTRSPTPTSVPDNTIESALEDGLDATASSGVDRQVDLNEGSGSTSVETVRPPRDPLNGESRRSPKVKENAAANEAAAKKVAVKEAREKALAAKKEAREKAAVAKKEAKEKEVAAKKESKEKEVAAKKEAKEKEVAAKKEEREKAAAAKSESREKEAAAKKEAIEKEAAAKKEAIEKEARGKEAAAKKEATANETTATTATGVEPTSTGETALSQRSRKKKGETQKESSANATSGTAGIGQSQSRAKRSSTKAQGEKFDSIPMFSRFDEEEFNTRAIHDELFIILKYNDKAKGKQRSTEPLSDGYVYIYTSPQCHGHVKIGMTKTTPRARISQWKKSCKLEITLVEDRESHRFFHFQLVEKLVQNELRNQRCKYRCHNCRKAHTPSIQEDTDGVHHGEWYAISEELALATVQKWRRWLVKNRPYNTDGILRPIWNEKYKAFLKETALVDKDKWVEAWVQPLTTSEAISYFWIYSIKTIKDTSSKFRTFLKLVLGLLTPLQRICERGVDVLPSVGLVVFVLIAAYFILIYITPLCAFLFVPSMYLLWLWINC